MAATIVLLPIALLGAAFSAWAFWRGYKSGVVHVLDWFHFSRAHWPVFYVMGLAFWAIVFTAFGWLVLTGLADMIAPSA